MDALLFPFQLPFMRDAFLITLLIAPAAAFLSCFLVLKGWALIGDAISHAVLPGIVLAYIAGIPLIIGAFAAGLFSSLATGFLKDNSRVKQDTVMGVVFSGMFATGLLLYTQIESEVHLDYILFGNLLGVGSSDLWTTAAISLPVALLILAKHRDFLAHAFDPVQARMLGLRVGWLHYGLLAILSATVVSMLTSVGIILSIAYLITPGATAFLLTRRFSDMMAVALGSALFAGVAGVYASFWADSAPASTIVLFLSGQFSLAFGYKLLRDRLIRRRSA